MKNETYLMINGQKIELTAEQKKQLGIIETKSCFDRADKYYYINYRGDEQYSVDTGAGADDLSYVVANYCTDRDLMHQRALHETLNRLLWRYSMMHDGDKIDWNDGTVKYSIVYANNVNRFAVSTWRHCKSADICFNSEYIAQNAIEEIIKPFMEEHPDFVW